VAQYSPVRFSQVSGTWPELGRNFRSAEVPPKFRPIISWAGQLSKAEVPALLAGTSGGSRNFRPSWPELPV
jgi:hypothetical protein